MLKKVAFTMYPVLDISRARNFYKQNLGLIPSKLIGLSAAWSLQDGDSPNLALPIANLAKTEIVK